MFFEARWSGLSFLCLSLAVLGPIDSFGAEQPVTTRPPNFVLLLADDLGWSDLACYGADLHETPNLDRLARESVKFTDAYASASVCTPTRAAIMTGKFPARLHMTIWHEASQRPPQNRRLIPPITVGNLPHEEITIAEVLQSAGYLTAHVGKWHLGIASHYPQTQGFDMSIGGTFWGAPPTYFYPYRGHFGRSEEVRYVPHLEWGEPGEYLTDRLTDEALKILEAAKDRPFFLYLAYHTVHTPIEAKQESVDHFANELSGGMHHSNPTFAAMVGSLDENVGRILEKIDKLGISERTVVIFTSDNGGFINNYQKMPVTNNYPLRSGKGSLYEGGVRVPLIVRWPGVTPRGAICHEPVSSMDLYPTILDMSGLRGEVEHNVLGDNESLAGLLRDPQSRLNREAMYWHYPHYYSTTTPVSAIRTGDWKLLEFHEDMHIELYNLREDIGEQHDLADKMPDRTRQMRRWLHRWREALSAQMPSTNPKYQH